MSKEINLGISRKRLFAGSDIWKRRLRLISSLCLSLTSLVALGIFLLVLTSPLGRLEKQQEQLTKDLNVLAKRGIRYQLMQQRLADTRKILNTRPAFDKIITLMNEGLPGDVSLTSIMIQNKEVTVSFISTSLTSLSTTIDSFTKTKFPQKKIKTVSLSALSYDTKAGRYVLTLDLLLP